MIVEDNAAMRRLIKSLVQDLADLVIECGDGAEAFAAFAMHQPDWVLMDIKMPEVDGIAATRHITATYPHAKVLIVTDYDDAKLREAARQAGAVQYIVKENLLELPRILGKFIRERNSGESI
jgi:CheY-like chemotaxis protein